MPIAIQHVSALRRLIFKITRVSKLQTANISLSNTEMNILGHLDRNSQLLPSEFAEMEHISAQAISQNLNSLFAAGYINKVADGTDKRKTIITLSDFGQAKLLEIKSTRDSWLKTAIEERLTEQEIEALLNIAPILEKLTTNP